jgi:mannose-1-phosphate guanylyltransferase
VINELGLPVLGIGLKNIVISASPEGILVSDKEQSSYIKPYVDAIDQQIMFAEKSWGSYRVLDVEEESMMSFGELFAVKPSHYLPPVIRDLMWNVTMVAGG